MTDDPTCETCRWWTPPSQSVRNSCPPHRELIGSCTNSLAYVEDPTGENRTSALWFCDQHIPKEKTDDKHDQ